MLPRPIRWRGRWPCSVAATRRRFVIVRRAVPRSTNWPAACPKHWPLPYMLTVHVIDVPIVNAFALPGGHVLLLRGLISRAPNTESVTGVWRTRLAMSSTAT